MRKFVVQSKADKTVVSEVECKLVTPLEDSSVLWLAEGEYLMSINLPTSFHQKKIVKDKERKTETVVMVPDVWCWHSLFDSQAQALAHAGELIAHEMQVYAKQKHLPVATDEEVQQALSLVEVVLLT